MCGRTACTVRRAGAGTGAWPWLPELGTCGETREDRAGAYRHSAPPRQLSTLPVANGYPFAAYLQGASFSAPDDYTFVIELEESNASFLPLMAQAANWYGKILPKHIYEGEDWATTSANENPIGTGPFKFDSWEPDQQVRLVANDEYFLGRPAIDELIVGVMPDTLRSRYGELLEVVRDLGPRTLGSVIERLDVDDSGEKDRRVGIRLT